MKKYICLFIVVLILSGCSNNDLLTKEILQLEKQISEQEEEIERLKEASSYDASLNDANKLSELRASLEMVRWSSIARLDDDNDSFYNLTNVYKIHSEHSIKDDWYVINDDYFEIELLNYETAEKVDFYILRLESDGGPSLVFTDTNHKDGWKYTNEAIGEIISQQGIPASTYTPFFIIYAEATLEDGDIIKTSNLPIYNRKD